MVEKANKNNSFNHFTLDNKIRGEFLLQSIVVESIIDTMIGFHICQDQHKRELLLGLILNNLNFANKIRIINKIIEIDYPEFNKKYPELENKLEEIKKFRNLLAHASAGYTQKFLAKNLKDRIVLTVYENGKRKERIVTIKDVQEKTSIIMKLIEILLEFQGTIWQRHGIKSYN